MAKYDITHSCGHVQVHQIFGKHSGFGGRESKIAWLETTLCTECYRAEQDKQHAAEAAAASEQNAAAGLPALTGSPKQIAWAETIRSTALASAAKEEEQFRGRLSADLSPEIRLEVTDALCLLVGDLRDHVESRFWIDNRDDFRGWIAAQLRKRIGALCPAYTAAQAAQDAAGTDRVAQQAIEDAQEDAEADEFLRRTAQGVYRG